MLRAERCDGCGFDARAWSRGDLIHTLEAIGPWWRETTVGAGSDVLGRRPEPATWSAVEYAAHSRAITAGLGRLLHAALTVDDLDLRLPPQDVAPDIGAGFDAVVRDLERAANRMAALAARTKGDRWKRTAVIDGQPLDAEDVLAHAVHDATHHLRDLGRGLHRLGVPPGPRAGVGTVLQLNASAGGVPKTAVPSARIDAGGMQGDRQRVRRHHGRPWQALCLWSAEVIERLAAEGHPLGPGVTGENVTIAGIDWSAVRPGVRLEIGPALIETSLWALPCKQNARWFLAGDFTRMHHQREWGVSRIYAWVLRGGEVHAGDPVVVEP